MADEGDKGKGKGKASGTNNVSDAQRNAEGTSTSRSGASGAAQSLASALRTTMASSQLGSLMANASGGKAEFAPRGGSSGDLKDWLVQDLRSSSSSSAAVGGTGVGGAGVSSFRSAPTQAAAQSAEQAKMFDDFQQGLTLDQRGQATSAEAAFKPQDGLLRMVAALLEHKLSIRLGKEVRRAQDNVLE